MMMKNIEDGQITNIITIFVIEHTHASSILL